MSLSWGLWLFLLLDFMVHAPGDPYGFGVWRLNPVWDFLFLRIGGPFLYGNHVVTALLLLSIAPLGCVRDGYRRMPVWLTMVFATVFIHEVIIQSFGYFPYGNLVLYQMYSPYMEALAVFGVLAYAVGDQGQRRTLLRIALVCLGTEGVAMLLYAAFNYHPTTLQEFVPGPQLYDPLANGLEDFYWLAAMAPWLLLWNGKVRHLHPHNWLRVLTFARRPVPLELTWAGRLVWFKERKDWEAEYLPRSGVKGKTVLDVGAGAGETAAFFFDHGAAKVICVEPDPKAVAMLRRNADRFRWNVQVFPEKLSLAHMALPFDWAKIDCEGAERQLLALDTMPPSAVEIHTRRLAKAFGRRFPSMQIAKKYHWPFRTWMGRTDG